MKIGIWGLGYIGLTTGMAYASRGVEVFGYDPDPDVHQLVRVGKVPQPNIESWTQTNLKELVDEGLIQVVNYKRLLEPDIEYQFICVPTEKLGEPTNEYLEDVLKKLSDAHDRKIVIIESTLIPGTAEKLLTKHLIAVAPRRDFFESPEKNIKTLPRVYACAYRSSADKIREILSVVCDKLIEAPSLKEAELVKSVENSLLYLPVVYAMQLSKAYPDVDIRRVLQLASTHWRIPLYYPSIGTSGYCIPTSPKYVIKGSMMSDELALLKLAMNEEVRFTRYITRTLRPYKDIAVLGIAYKPDLKVHKGSAALTILRGLADLDPTPLVHDPYYTSEELKAITGFACPMKYPENLQTCRAVLVATAHKRYVRTPIDTLLKYLGKCELIIDNTGAWEQHRARFKEKRIRYWIVGEARTPGEYLSLNELK